MINKVYGWITERIVAMLATGVVAWRRPWLLKASAMNLVSGKAYRGINRFSLAVVGEKYTSRYWLTHKQARDRGGFVRKGEKSAMVVYYSTSEKKRGGVVVTDSKGRPQKSFFLRYSNVFNVEQCDGIKYPLPDASTNVVDPIDACEDLIGSWSDCPTITHAGDRAFYRFADDTITMPERDTFETAAGYYATLFHEIIHATGHPSRCDRPLENSFGSSDYAREELVAEMGSAFLCGIVGIDCKTIDNAASYIANWVRRIKSDDKLVVRAASQGQRAAEYVQGIAAPSYDSDKGLSLKESDSQVALA